MEDGKAVTKTISLAEISQHSTSSSCWIILYRQVYDVTSFLSQHPGGSKIILKYAGKDATAEYDPIHQTGTIERSLSPASLLGVISVSENPVSTTKLQSHTDPAVTNLNQLLNLSDIEKAAKSRIASPAWAYYFSGSNDLLTKYFNNTVYQQIFLRPRIFVDSVRCESSTTILGHKVGLPIYVAPTARVRLGHPDGEKGIAKGISSFGALQIVSNHSSRSVEEIVEDCRPGQVFGWQLYVQKDRSKSEKMLQRVNKLSVVKFIALTLDVITATRREMEERLSEDGADLSEVPALLNGSDFGGVNKELTGGKAMDLTWASTLTWLESHTHLPIVLKGVQTYEDALLASRYPQVKAIIISNHGGRAIDTASPPVHVLLEIQRYCPEVFHKMEIWVDGGIQRGSDIVKALCLGAKAVGIGRAAFYGLAAGGEKGVERTFKILKSEMETCMRLSGVNDVSHLGPEYVNTSVVERDIYNRRRLTTSKASL